MDDVLIVNCVSFKLTYFSFAGTNSIPKAGAGFGRGGFGRELGEEDAEQRNLEMRLERAEEDARLRRAAAPLCQFRAFVNLKAR